MQALLVDAYICIMLPTSLEELTEDTENWDPNERKNVEPTAFTYRHVSRKKKEPRLSVRTQS